MHWTLKDELSRREAYATPLPARIEARETATSWLFLSEREVYKVKRPRALGFVDNSTLELRQRGCEAEVMLGARLAPGTYLGVAPVRRGPDGLATFAGEGAVVDWAVHMLRLPDVFRADMRVLGDADIDRVADHIASFHAHCASDPSFGGAGELTRHARESMALLRSSAKRFVAGPALDALERKLLGFVERNADLLALRAEGGFVRECHGDMRLEHVFFDGEAVAVVDAETDPRLRFVDVTADVAFLAMDLRAHGRRDLANRLLGRYRRVTSDDAIPALCGFYETQYAVVRAGLAALHGDVQDSARYLFVALGSKPLPQPPRSRRGGSPRSRRPSETGLGHPSAWPGQPLTR